MKKLLALLLILTMILSCFVGCNDSTGKSDSKKDDVSDYDDDDRDNDRDDDNRDDADDKDDDDKVADDNEDKQETTEGDPTPAPTAPSVNEVVGAYALAFDADMLSEFGDIDEEIAELVEIGLDFSFVITLNADETASVGFNMATGEELVDFIIEWSIAYAAEVNGMTYDECMDLLIEAYGSEEAVKDYFLEEMESELEEMQDAIDELMDEYANITGTYYVDGDSVFITIDGDEEEFFLENGDLVAYDDDGYSLVFKRQ